MDKMKKLQYSLIAVVTAISLGTAFPAVPHAGATSQQFTALASNPIVADAAMYRGTITEVYESEGNTVIKLEQAAGTNFGSPSLTLNITKDTALSFEKADLKEGVYLEAFYNPANASVLQAEDAIQLNKLIDAKSSIYNGTVVSITPDKDQNGFGDIQLKDLNGENETIFHYSDKTSIQIDLAKVKAGDKLNIYHKGAFTRSIPPQGNALEIRAAADTSLYRGTVTKVSTKNGITTLSLKRAEGTNFKNGTQQIQINKNTRTDIAASKIKKGMYLEVFYVNTKKTPIALSVDQLFENNAVNYNGEVTEVTPDKEKDGYGSILMKDLKGGNETIFHYSPFTKFNIALEDLKNGAKVNIYHKGISTMSIPPQCIALEISSYNK